MASEYLKWKYRDVKPDAPAQYTKRQRAANWWHYHRWWLLAGAALLVALAFGGLTFLLFRVKDECRVEYDYAFTNGNLDVSKVMNERRRRYLCAMDTKDVISCGPAQGPAFQKALNEPGVKTHNWFVNRDAKLYYFYFQRKNMKHVIIVELNDEMVAMIRSKNYLPRGVWYDENGNSSYGASIS